MPPVVAALALSGLGRDALKVVCGLGLAGMLWVVQTGSSWRDLPEQFGAWETVHTRYQRWRKAGIWQQILDTLQHEDTVNGT